jgi:hypothetical protein
MTIVMSCPLVFGFLGSSSRYRLKSARVHSVWRASSPDLLGDVAFVRDNPISSTHCKPEHGIVAGQRIGRHQAKA